MTDQPPDPVAPPGGRPAGATTAPKPHHARRKAALQANMARRKAQVRGREKAASADGPADNDTRNE